MVGIHLDANYIFCELMKNRTEDKMITAYQRMVDRMAISGLGLKHHRLDNECSEKFKQCIKKNEMTHELVPPDNHWRNIAKQAVQTFKKSLYIDPKRRRRPVPTFFVVSPGQTRQTHRKPTTTKQRHSQSLGIRAHTLAAQLHEAIVCPSGQTTIATTLGSTPGALAFAQDMCLYVLPIADWQAIALTCEHHLNENL
jgi:hypothetical protein